MEQIYYKCMKMLKIIEELQLQWILQILVENISFDIHLLPSFLTRLKIFFYEIGFWPKFRKIPSFVPSVDVIFGYPFCSSLPLDISDHFVWLFTLISYHFIFSTKLYIHIIPTFENPSSCFPLKAFKFRNTSSHSNFFGNSSSAFGTPNGRKVYARNSTTYIKFGSI